MPLPVAELRRRHDDGAGQRRRRLRQPRYHSGRTGRQRHQFVRYVAAATTVHFFWRLLGGVGDLRHRGPADLDGQVHRDDLLEGGTQRFRLVGIAWHRGHYVW